jgi:transcriptional regulator with XRE-family HTH domain
VSLSAAILLTNPVSEVFFLLSNEERVNALVSVRLKEERKRLGLSQEQAAKALSVSTRTIYTYENAKAAPPISVLLTLAQLGADIMYIITGEHESGRLPDTEQQLITSFRSAPAPVQAGIMAMLQVSLPSNEEAKPKVRQQFLGKVGQVVDGKGKVKIKTFKC